MRYMYYCGNCDYLASDESEYAEYACPKCGVTLFPTGYRRDEWVKKGDYDKLQIKESWKRKIIEYQEKGEDALSSMILSTCPSLDGFHVKEYLGLVFGECAYKTGFMKSLSATFENMGDILSAGDKELSGTSRMLESAREYAIQKMKKAARARGANAVIGIESESSIGGDIMHITIYGTAVALDMSKDEKPSSDRDSTPSAFDMIIKEMAGMDRSEKLVFLSDAYSKDKINYEEYRAIIKHENL